jgi:hypothetical protein
LYQNSVTRPGLAHSNHPHSRKSEKVLDKNVSIMRQTPGVEVSNYHPIRHGWDYQQLSLQATPDPDEHQNDTFTTRIQALRSPPPLLPLCHQVELQLRLLKSHWLHHCPLRRRFPALRLRKFQAFPEERLR